MLSSFPDQNEYRLPEFRQAFSRITGNLTRLKRKVVEFEAFFQNINPHYSHHANFYAMLMGSLRAANPYDIRALVAFMDEIDEIRNDILGELNGLLSRCGEPTFDTIDLTSQILKKDQIGGADEVSRLLE